MFLLFIYCHCYCRGLFGPESKYEMWNSDRKFHGILVPPGATQIAFPAGQMFHIGAIVVVVHAENYLGRASDIYEANGGDIGKTAMRMGYL